jgi:hypothetical protein
MEIDALLYAILIPTVAAAALLATLGVLRRRWPWCAWQGWPALALAGVVFCACAQQFGGVPWKPHISFDWFPWAIALTAALALVAHATDRSASQSLSLAGTALAASCAFVLASPAGLSTAARFGGAAVAAIATATAVHGTRRAGPSAALGMWGSAAALSGLVLVSGFAKLAIVLGAFSAMSAAIGVLGWVQRPLPVGPSAVAVWCAVMATSSMYAMGNDVTLIPSAAWWLAAASPAAAGLALIPKISSRPALANTVRVGAPIAAAALAALVGVLGAPPPQDSDSHRDSNVDYSIYGTR